MTCARSKSDVACDCLLETITLNLSASLFYLALPRSIGGAIFMENTNAI